MTTIPPNTKVSNVAESHSSVEEDKTNSIHEKVLTRAQTSFEELSQQSKKKTSSSKITKADNEDQGCSPCKDLLKQPPPYNPPPYRHNFSPLGTLFYP